MGVLHFANVSSVGRIHYLGRKSCRTLKMTLWFTRIKSNLNFFQQNHYNDIIMSTIVSQITSLTIVYLTVCSGTDQRKHQSSASMVFVWGIHRWPMNSPHKWPVMRKMFPFDDVIMMSDLILSPVTDRHTYSDHWVLLLWHSVTLSWTKTEWPETPIIWLTRNSLLETANYSQQISINLFIIMLQFTLAPEHLQ